MLRRYSLVIAMAVCASLALSSQAQANAQLIAVVAVDGGCVAGPIGPSVQFWDVQPGKTYELTISNVLECANGGLDATLNVRVNSSVSGNTDLVATFVAAGVYKFQYTVPANGACTFPIRYCTTPGDNSSGILVFRADGGLFQAHLRAAAFTGPLCTLPVPIDAGCDVTPSRSATWSQVKSFYR